jgi:acyl carrier protein
MSLLESIRDIFAAELGLPSDEFRSDLKYGETPEWDSASHMIIVLALEERFEIAFESDEIVMLSSVGAIEAALREKGAVDT